MEKPVVFVLDTFHTDAIATLRKDSSVSVVVVANEPGRDWRDEATGVIVRSETRITSSDLTRAKKLKIIVKQGVGVDNIDVDAAKQRGIAVCNTPALNSEAVAELTISLASNVARRVSEFDRRIRSGEKVKRSLFLGQSLFQKTIGIVGMGNIAKFVAQKWIGAMDGQIVAFDPHAPEGLWKDIPHTRVRHLDELVSQADVITFHVPLTSETRRMISDVQFDTMKPTAILVNCAQGGVVDETALVNALRAKKIYGAAVDAFEVEPPTLEAYGSLLSNENIIVTPHVGGNTLENQIKSGVAAAETVLAVLRGTVVSNRLV